MRACACMHLPVRQQRVLLACKPACPTKVSTPCSHARRLCAGDASPCAGRRGAAAAGRGRVDRQAAAVSAGAVHGGASQRQHGRHAAAGQPAAAGAARRVLRSQRHRAPHGERGQAGRPACMHACAHCVAAALAICELATAAPAGAAAAGGPGARRSSSSSTVDTAAPCLPPLAPSNRTAAPSCTCPRGAAAAPACAP